MGVELEEEGRAGAVGFCPRFGAVENGFDLDEWAQAMRAMSTLAGYGILDVVLPGGIKHLATLQRLRIHNE